MTFFLRQRVMSAAARLAGCVRNDFGGIAATFAVALPVLIGAAGLAIDFATLTMVKGDLQAAADAAAMAGAREIQVAKSDPNQVINAAIAHAKFQLTGDPNPQAKPGTVDPLTVSAQVVDKMSAVQVDISEAWTPFFAHFLKADITPVTVTATARFVGSTNICVLGLSPTLVPGVKLWQNAQLTANNCGVYSDTDTSKGFVVADAGQLKSQLNCVVGGYSTSGALAVEPTPLTSCPVLADPLQSRPAPSFGGCDFTSLVVNNQNRALLPGVYCGGLTIKGTSKVTMDSGVYVIKDGPLLVTDTATLDADNAGFYMTGPNSLAWFTANTSISLSAPVDGPLAGLLFFEDRAASGVRLHRFASNNARKLLGTIYLSRSILNIDADAPVADQSAYTAIVTQSLQLQSGPNLVLNSDYSATDVPVPEGIKGTSKVVITQ